MKIFQKIIPLLPYFISKHIIRKKYDIHSHPPAGTVIKIAETRDEFEQAFELVQNAYKDINLVDSNAPKLRVTKYHALPTTTVFIAKKDNIVIATLSVITKIKFSLPMEELFDISSLEKKGRVCEVSSLAVHKDHRKLAGKVSLPLMLFMFKYSLFRLGNCFMVICIHPKASLFYRSLFHFKPLSKEIKHYQYVNNAPAYSMYCDMNALAKKTGTFKDNYHYSVAQILTGQDRSFTHMPKGKYYFPLGRMLNKEMFNYFFKEKTSIFNELPEDDKDFLRDVYNVTEQEKNGNTSGKYYIYIAATLLVENEIFDMDTVYLTKDEILCKRYNNISSAKNAKGHIKLDLSRYESIILETEIFEFENYFHLKISPTSQWFEFLDYLNSQVNSTELSTLDDEAA